MGKRLDAVISVCKYHSPKYKRHVSGMENKDSHKISGE